MSSLRLAAASVIVGTAVGAGMVLRWAYKTVTSWPTAND